MLTNGEPYYKVRTFQSPRSAFQNFRPQQVLFNDEMQSEYAQEHVIDDYTSSHSYRQRSQSDHSYSTISANLPNNISVKLSDQRRLRRALAYQY